MSLRSDSVTVDTSEVDKRLEGIQKNLGPKGLKDIGNATVRLLDHDVRQSIEVGRSPSGKLWETRKSNPGWAPLQHTGQLKNSIDPKYKNFGATLLVQGAIKPGTRSGGKRRHGEVAGVQQFGRPSGSKFGRMPARQFMGLTRASFAALARLSHKLMGKD